MEGEEVMSTKQQTLLLLHMLLSSVYTMHPFTSQHVLSLPSSIYRVGLKGMQGFEIFRYNLFPLISGKGCGGKVASGRGDSITQPPPPNIKGEMLVLPRERSQPHGPICRSATSERLVNYLATTYKPFSPTLYLARSFTL